MRDVMGCALPIELNLEDSKNSKEQEVLEKAAQLSDIIKNLNLSLKRTTCAVRSCREVIKSTTTVIGELNEQTLE